jgi:hypothetical protein
MERTSLKVDMPRGTPDQEADYRAILVEMPAWMIGRAAAEVARWLERRRIALGEDA